MKRIKYISVFLVLALLASCSSVKRTGKQSYSVTPLSDAVSVSNGAIVYGLPRTVFTVKVRMNRTVEVKGPYSQFAENLLGLRNIIKSDREYWEITGITVNSHEELDPSELYIIESGAAMEANMLTLKSEGFILDLNPESNKSDKSMETEYDFDLNRYVAYDLGSDEYYFTQVDTGYRRLSFDSTFISVPYVVERRTPLSSAQLAEKAANRIIEIREGKFLVLTGEANVFPQSDAAIKELNKMEKEYTELFVGKRYTETRYYTVQVIPTSEIKETPVELFKFSELTGVEEIESVMGEPVTITLVPERKLKDLSMITKSEVVDPKVQNDKIFYRIPDVVNVSIDYEGEKLYSSRKLVYQFGEITQLPSNYIIGK